MPPAALTNQTEVGAGAEAPDVASDVNPELLG